MPVKVDLQLSPGAVTWEQLRDSVVAAEAAGFDCAWVFDHFMGDMISGRGSMLDPFALLGALAAATSRIGLGTLVLNVVNRSAPVIAIGAATVQTISGGRMTVGLGAGAAPATRWAREHEVLGLPLEPTLAGRHRRLGTTLDALDRFWAVDRDDELATFPRPEPRPPIVLGVNGVELAVIAGQRGDGINVRSNHPQLQRLLVAATDARAAAGRIGDPWDASVWAPWDEALLDADHPQRREWQRLGITRLVLVGFEAITPDAVERAAEHLSATAGRP
jgi:alkanesulfonate monooxygenase SsuD/methylene tetrahydromethanopterin reductase-like flavin-dependent oxidoreductase (luciferase family)